MDPSVLSSLSSGPLQERLTSCLMSEDNSAFIYVCGLLFGNVWFHCLFVGRPHFLQLLACCLTSDITLCGKSIFLQLKLRLPYFHCYSISSLALFLPHSFKCLPHHESESSAGIAGTSAGIAGTSAGIAGTSAGIAEFNLAVTCIKLMSACDWLILTIRSYWWNPAIWLQAKYSTSTPNVK